MQNPPNESFGVEELVVVALIIAISVTHLFDDAKVYFLVAIIPVDRWIPMDIVAFSSSLESYTLEVVGR